MKTSLPLRSLLLAVCIAHPACDDDNDPSTADSASEKTESAPSDAKPAAGSDVGSAADAPTADTGATKSPAPRPQGGTGVDKFKMWRPVHALLNAPVVRATSVGGSCAVVVTKDNHVGVTTDGGESWSFARHIHGAVLAADGYDGGPYVVTGGAGYAAVSSDGAHWSDRHRYTNNALVGVVAAPFGIVAISRRGDFVLYAKTGQTASAGVFPNKFKPKSLFEHGDAVVAAAGKKAYRTIDGVTWTQMDSAPRVGRGKETLTSAGACKLAKVGKNKGVVCVVKGTAHGLGSGVAAVENKGTVALTTDGGKAWTTARLPFTGVNAVFGTGPYYAVGTKGNVAKSTDGSLWKDQAWDGTTNFTSGLVDGSTVIVIGTGSTIVVSLDGGGKWDYVDPPVGGSFNSVVKRDGSYVVSDGSTVLTSAQGTLWVEDVDAQPTAPAKTEDCTTLPAAGERCQFYAQRTTPAGIPKVRTISFSGNAGIATGDSALVAMSTDGGTNWKVRTGLGLGRTVLFDTRGTVVAASNGKRVVVSNDSGTTWSEIALSKKASLRALHVATNGNIYAAGSSGTLLVSMGDHSVFVPAETGSKDRTKYISILEAAGAIYAVGAKGELWRSSDGAVFSKVVTGTRAAVQALAASGDTLVAVTAPGRRSGNTLLRSEDGGAHFYAAGELADFANLSPTSLYFKGDTLHFRARVSQDFGRSWHRESENYWSGAVDAGDGLRLSNRVSGFSKDRLFVITGDGERDWVQIEDVFSEGGRLNCQGDSGCWMVAGGTVYRPL